jgi:ribose transport system substrate-binding protein
MYDISSFVLLFGDLMKSLLLTTFYLLSICAVIGCSKNSPDDSDNSQNDAAEKKVVGILVQTTQNPFFIDFKNACEEELGSSYQIQFFGGENDADKQAKQITDLVNQKVDALLITPCNANAVGAPIRDANAAGIPVFTADTACLDTDVKIINHVATDNYDGGKLAGKAMIKALNNRGGKILILDYEQAESCQQRVRGFKEAIAAYNKNPMNENAQIEIVAQLPSGAEENASRQQMKDAIKGDRDLVGVFAINDPAAIGAVSAIEEENLQDQIKVIGFDGQMIGKLAIRDGRIFADPVQFPKRMGKLSAQYIKKYFAGEEVQPVHMIKPELYYREDALADPELKDK